MQLNVPQGHVFCPLCKLMIIERHYDRHRRRCSGEDVQQPILPIQKRTSSQSSNQDIQCKICWKTMSIQQYNAHYFSCTSPKAPCQFCKKPVFLFRLEYHQSRCSVNLLNQRQQQLKKKLRQDYEVKVHGSLSIEIWRLLINDVLPALQNMDKGLKCSEIAKIPTKEFKKEEEEEEKQKCTICIENIHEGQKIKQYKCLHIFHEQCAIQALKRSSVCPNCRCQIQTTK